MNFEKQPSFTPEEKLETQKEMHMKDRAMRVDETLRDYMAEREKSWKEKQQSNKENSEGTDRENKLAEMKRLDQEERERKMQELRSKLGIEEKGEQHSLQKEPKESKNTDGDEKESDLSPEQKEELMETVKKENIKIYSKRRMHLNEDLLLTSQGVNPDTSEKFFDRVDGDIGKFFDAHGIAKTDQLNNLLGMLERGIDPEKSFHTAPFEIPDDDRAGLGSALGTGGGTAYKDGMATLTSGYKERLSESGIKHVFINDIYASIKEPLAKLYPRYNFHLLSEQKQVMEEEEGLSKKE